MGETDDHEAEAAYGPECGQRVDAHEAADDDGVDHGVDLLEEVAQEEGQGECDKQLEGGALRHVLFHSAAFYSRAKELSIHSRAFAYKFFKIIQKPTSIFFLKVLLSSTVSDKAPAG